MTDNWMTRLDIDVERDLPRSWWADGEDDCLPDGLTEDEAWALIRRSAPPPHRATALMAESAWVGVSRAVAVTGPARMPPETTRDGLRADETAHPDSVLLRPREVAQRIGHCESRVYELMGSGELPSVTIGRSRRVRLTDLMTFIEDLTA